MKVFTFTCPSRQGVRAVSIQPDGGNIPSSQCDEGQWMAGGHIDLSGPDPAALVPGLDLDALRADLDEKGWHIFEGAAEDSSFNEAYL